MPEVTTHDGEAPSIEARVYHLECEAQRISNNAHSDRSVLNATVIRVAVIEAKNALWGAIFGAGAAALIEVLSKHL
jgi:hypothetical protein